MTADLAILDDLVPVLLAGGSGTRLWPASRAALPKHLVDLFGSTSLLQETVRRITAVAPPGRLLTVAAASQAMLIRRQLGELGPGLDRHLLLEPMGRNTAAAVAVAALAAEALWGGRAILWVCPSDHLVTAPEALYAAVAAGAEAARAGLLVTFGITASRPETGYGYIRLGQPLEQAPGVLAAAAFVEKPAAERAAAMLAEGGFVWNSGMFLYQVGAILAELEAWAPDVLSAVRAAMRQDAAGRVTLDARGFAAVPSAPIDKAVMERSAKVAVVPCAPGWSDVGSWQAIWEISAADAAGNALFGDAVVVDGRNNLVRADGRLVALAGVDDLAVIETADAVLVAARTDAEAVKALVARLADAGRPEVVRHRHEPMPWGILTRLVERPGYALRERLLDPGATLELPADAVAGVVWTVIEGRLELEAGAGGALHAAGATVRATAGLPHRLTNAGDGKLRLVELQCC
jgi:mannose-1-phosphate guanylyltransferase / mannose-6-phosphate isomerase